MQFFVVISLNDLQVDNDMFYCINKFMIDKTAIVDNFPQRWSFDTNKHGLN